MWKLTAIIPARKESKSVRNKNRVLLNNIPLVEYSIIAAKQCKFIGNVILSSDDKVILDIGKKHNIDLIERPKNLAADTTKTIDVIKHAIKIKDVLDDLILLEPTSPIRLIQDLEEGINEYFTKNLDSLYSVSELKSICIAHIKRLDNQNRVYDAFVKEIEGAPRQHYNDQKYYIRDGIFYIFKKKLVLKEDTLYGINSKAYITPHEVVDINSIDDLRVAERLISQSPFNFYKKHKIERKIIYIDIDDTICFTPKNGDYSMALPIEKNIEKANQLYEQGNYIVYWTARGTVTGINWCKITEDQFKNWKVKYHELKFGKPNYDLLIDDRVLNANDWK